MIISGKCAFCRKPFTGVRLNKIYCSDPCRFAYNNRIKSKKLQFAKEAGFDRLSSFEGITEEEVL